MTSLFVVRVQFIDTDGTEWPAKAEMSSGVRTDQLPWRRRRNAGVSAREYARVRHNRIDLRINTALM